MMSVLGFWLTGSAVQAITPDIEWTGDLLPFYGKVSAVCRSKEAVGELVRWFGHEDFCPFQPVLLCIPGGWGQLDGQGLATASELRDEGIARWELQEAKLARTGHTFDFDEARERAGLLRHEDVKAAMQEAAMDNIRRHRASPVTDPAPQYNYPNPTNRRLFAVGDAVMPKESSE